MKIQTLPTNKSINFNGVYFVDSKINARPNQITNRGTIELYKRVDPESTKTDILYVTKGGATSSSPDFQRPALLLTNDHKGTEAKTYLDFSEEYEKILADYGQKNEIELQTIAEGFIKEESNKKIDNFTHSELKNYVSNRLEHQQDLEKAKLGRGKDYTFINEKYKQERAIVSSKSFEELKDYAKTITKLERPKMLEIASGNNLVNYVRRLARKQFVEREFSLYEEIFKKATKIKEIEINTQARTILKDVASLTHKI